MGTQVPPEQPILDPALWYRVSVIVYSIPGCTGDGLANECCKTGASIIAYIDDDHDCKPTGLCGPPVVGTNRLKSFAGPFDDEASCLLTL